MRIISGTARGTKLNTLEGENTRPTLDRVKEPLFSIIQSKIKDSVVLDLFSGSGAISIEAYSRGASSVYLNEKNRDVLKVINSNLDKLGITDIKVLNKDYKDALAYLSSKQIKFDIIFLDPPYKMIIDESFINAILLYNILNKDGIIVAETDYDIDKNLVEKYNVKILKYGRSLMNIIRGF